MLTDTGILPLHVTHFWNCRLAQKSWQHWHFSSAYRVARKWGNLFSCLHL